MRVPRCTWPDCDCPDSLCRAFESPGRPLVKAPWFIFLCGAVTTLFVEGIIFKMFPFLIWGAAFWWACNGGPC